MLLLICLGIVVLTQAGYPDVDVPQQQDIHGWWRIEETELVLQSERSNKVLSWKSDQYYNNSDYVEEIKSIWYNQFMPVLDNNVSEVYDTVQDKYVRYGLVPKWPGSVGFGGLQVGQFEGRLPLDSTIAYVFKLKDVMLGRNQGYPQIELVFGAHLGVILRTNVENDYFGFEWLCYAGNDTGDSLPVDSFCQQGTDVSFQSRSWPRIKLTMNEETIVVVLSTNIYEQDELETDPNDPDREIDGGISLRLAFGSYESIWMQQDKWTIANASNLNLNGIGYVWGTSSHDLKYSTPVDQLGVELFEVIYYGEALSDVTMYTLVKFLQQKYNRDDVDVDFKKQVQEQISSDGDVDDISEEIGHIISAVIGLIVGIIIIIVILLTDKSFYEALKFDNHHRGTGHDFEDSSPTIDKKFRLRTMSSMLLPSFIKGFRSSSKVFPDEEDYRCFPAPKKVKYQVTDPSVHVGQNDTAQEG